MTETREIVVKLDPSVPRWIACYEPYETGDHVGRGESESDAIADLLMQDGRYVAPVEADAK
jgi:hypothetical protein